MFYKTQHILVHNHGIGQYQGAGNCSRGEGGAACVILVLGYGTGGMGHSWRWTWHMLVPSSAVARTGLATCDRVLGGNFAMNKLCHDCESLSNKYTFLSLIGPNSEQNIDVTESMLPAPREYKCDNL